MNKIAGTFIRITLFTGLVSLVLACGVGAEEKARLATRQKERDDSIRLTVERETRQRLAVIHALKDSIQSGEAHLEGLSNRLIYMRGELEAARDKLLVIKQPQFLRTPDERESQIRDQTIRIQQLENEVQNILARGESLGDTVKDWKNSLKKLGQ